MPLTQPFQQSVEACALLGVERRSIPLPDGTIGVQLEKTRVLPGARVARVPRFGRGLSARDLYAAIEGLRDLAAEPLILRVHVEVYCENPPEHAAIEAALAEAGFTEASERRSYLRTLWMDLEPSEDDLLASMHKTGRRNVRLPTRRGFAVEPLPRDTPVAILQALFSEAFESTGSPVPEVDWAAWLDLAARRPDLLHMVGVRPEGEEEWAGFCVGVSHGEVAEYHHAASTRRGPSNVPLLYAPLWEVILWAKRSGARWFDFGGVTGGSDDAEDPLAGISSFKRYFCRDLARVGGEWILEPPSMAGRLWKTARRIKDVASG